MPRKRWNKHIWFNTSPIWYKVGVFCLMLHRTWLPFVGQLAAWLWYFAFSILQQYWLQLVWWRVTVNVFASCRQSTQLTFFPISYPLNPTSYPLTDFLPNLIFTHRKHKCHPAPTFADLEEQVHRTKVLGSGCGNWLVLGICWPARMAGWTLIYSYMTVRALDIITSRNHNHNPKNNHNHQPPTTTTTERFRKIVQPLDGGKHNHITVKP